MRFLHGVVDMDEVADKLKQKFPDEAMEKVSFCACVRHVCVCVCVCVDRWGVVKRHGFLAHPKCLP